MFFGKVIGGLIGLSVSGVFGLLFGVFIGHMFDRGLNNALRFSSPENVERVKNSFFETTFLLAGYLAKIDGHVSRTEIDHTESFIAQMGLSGDQRQRAIDLFRQGSVVGFEIEPVVTRFLTTCGPRRKLQQTLLLFLISLAQVDKGIEPSEHAALMRIAGLMGLSATQLELMLRMASAQENFQQGSVPGSEHSLEDAYSALGVSSTIGDKELKRAYRKLMSQNHPDKLIAKGVPEDMIKLATGRAQEIQAAYEVIKKTRPDIR
ncbi:MAG: co-chaperone DjlA [Halioglobus sp.]|nr:co-chaperone DjlA [Halioglobus sp.]